MNQVATEELEQSILTAFRSMFENVVSIWRQLENSEEDQCNRSDAAKDRILKCIEEIHQSEVCLYEDTLKRIEKYTGELENLCRELDVDPFVMDESITLVEKEEQLRHQLEELTREKQTRLKNMQKLRLVEKRFCAMLNLLPIEIKLQTEVPSKSDLQNLKEHVEILKSEHERRYQNYCSAKQEVFSIIENTELPLETEFERDMMYNEENPYLLPIPLTTANLEKVDQIVATFRAKESELKMQKQDLLEKVMKLWDRLNIHTVNRERFLVKHDDCRITTLEKIQQEVNRCLEIKKKNMESYINIVHNELQELWKKCHVSDEHQKQFMAQFDASVVSEEVLSFYDAKVEEMSKYYQDTENILKKIQKRQELWDLLIEFANKAKDPERFKNRGGNLLKEERERKKIQKDLPKLESEIFKDITEYEKESGKTFLFDGIDFQEFVNNQWKQTQNEKENKVPSQKQRGQATSSTPISKRHIKVPQSAPGKLLKFNSHT